MLLPAASTTDLSLPFAGLLALADLSTISIRTALAGTPSYFDMLFLVPGLHKQQDATNVNGGDYPIVGAMTSGYVFRIENQATVFWLQRVGRPGHLVDAWVGAMESRVPGSSYDANGQVCRHPIVGLLPSPYVLYMVGIALTVTCFALLAFIRDYWAVAVLSMLVVARAVNVTVFKRRAAVGWKGMKEPGEQGDLLVLLSQDRWARIRGSVDDLKLVVSSQWIRDLEPVESFFVAGATLLVYGAAALAPKASTMGNLLIAALLVSSVALLGLCNAMSTDLCMFNRRVYQRGSPKAYARRVHMAEEMIEEHGGCRDWAVTMGLVLAEPGSGGTHVALL